MDYSDCMKHNSRKNTVMFLAIREPQLPSEIKDHDALFSDVLNISCSLQG